MYIKYSYKTNAAIWEYSNDKKRERCLYVSSNDLYEKYTGSASRWSSVGITPVPNPVTDYKILTEEELINYLNTILMKRL